jgi:hypothetical protein
MHETGVNIWRVLGIPDSDVIVDGVDPSTDPETRTSWEKVLEMDLNVRTNLIASALSDDGRWLVVSDLYEAKLFELSFNVSSAEINLVDVFLIHLTSACWSPQIEPGADICINIGESNHCPKLSESCLDRWIVVYIHPRLFEIDHGLCNNVAHPRY